jgi:hypothetical protein
MNEKGDGKMSAKFDWSKWEKELKDSAISVRKLAELAGVSKGTVQRERARLKALEDAKEKSNFIPLASVVPPVEAEDEKSAEEIEATPEIPVEEQESKSTEPDFQLTPQTEENLTATRPAKKEPALEIRARYNVGAAVALADPEKVAELEALAGKLYSIKDIAGYLKCTIRSVQNYLKSGKLKGVKINGDWLISAENFQRFMRGE